MVERITEKVKSVPIKRIPNHATICGGAVKVRHPDTTRRPGESMAQWKNRIRKSE